jgi:hypothetical protein
MYPKIKKILDIKKELNRDEQDLKVSSKEFQKDLKKDSAVKNIYNYKYFNDIIKINLFL